MFLIYTIGEEHHFAQKTVFSGHLVKNAHTKSGVTRCQIII